MDKNKKSFVGHIFKGSDTDIGSDFTLEMRGVREMSVGGCRGFYEYGESVIGLVLRNGRLKICGEGLICDSYTNGAVLIHGRICGISISEGNDEAVL